MHHSRRIHETDARLLVEKLLLTPTEQLKSLGDRETISAYSEALARLFGFGPPREPSARRPSGPQPALDEETAPPQGPSEIRGDAEPVGGRPAPVRGAGSEPSDRTESRVEPFVRSKGRPWPGSGR